MAEAVDPSVSAPPTAAKKIGFVIVDDHPLVREGLKALISTQPDLSVVGEVEGCVQALQVIEQLHPQVVIIDITLKDGDGLELTRQITERWHEILSVVVSMHDENIYAERALRAGARGYIRKVDAAETVLPAIRRILAGEIYIRPNIASQIVSRVAGLRRPRQHESPMERLTDRELQVLQCIGRGLGNREIAAELFISVKTVETHREHLKHKLRMGSSSELLRYAIEYFRV